MGIPPVLTDAGARADPRPPLPRLADHGHALPAAAVSPWRVAAPHAGLFVLTAASVWATAEWQWPGRGWHFMAALLAILFSHEMGHWLACRVYRVDATLPYFIPSPWLPVGAGLWAPLSFIGTFGAVIRIRGRIPHRRALFDIGVAGPLAGFAVLLPILFLGIGDGTWVPAPAMPVEPGEGGLTLGEPLLFQWAAAWALPGRPGMIYNIGPLGLAAWTGLLVTALNLLPVGQLDGGHVTHALLPRRAHLVSRTALVLGLGLLVFRPFWLLWTVLLWALARRRHPPTLDEARPVGAARAAVGVLALAVLVVCFTPSPVLVTWSDFGGMLGEIAGLVT